MRPYLSDHLQPLDGPSVGCRSFGVCEVRGVNQQAREVTAILSAPTVDAYGDIVLPEAVMKRLDRFKKNPVLLANHVHTADDGGSGIVGKWISIGIQKVPGIGRCVVGTCRFMDNDALAESWWQRFRQGMAVAFSIGFIVRGYEIRDIKHDGTTKRVKVFTDIELLEVSCVSVPACADAVVLAASLGGSGRGVPASAMQPDADIGGLLGGSGGDSGLSRRRMDKTLSRSISAIVQAEVRKQLNTDPGGELYNLIQDVAGCTAAICGPSARTASSKQSRRVVNHAPSKPANGIDELLGAPRTAGTGKSGGAGKVSQRAFADAYFDDDLDDLVGF